MAVKTVDPGVVVIEEHIGMSQRTRVSLAMAVVCLGAVLFASRPSEASPITVGNAVIERDYIDTCEGCAFVLTEAVGQEGVLSTWSFFADITGRTLTPLIYQLEAGSFVVTGIGQSVTVTTLGAQTYNFNTAQGTDAVTAQSYFGYRDGSTSSPNEGTISISDSVTGTLIRYFHPDLGGDGTLSVGLDLGSGNHLDRNYSLQAEVVTAAVPEPASLLLLGAGLAAAAGRRYKKRP